MDILIFARNHEHQEKLKEFYTDKIEKKFGGYKFINVIELNIYKKDNGTISMTMQIEVARGKTLFSKAEDDKETRCYNAVVNKIKVQLEKMKVNYSPTR